MNLASMQQGIKKLQWFEYLKMVFLEILNMLRIRLVRIAGVGVGGGWEAKGKLNHSLAQRKSCCVFSKV